MFICNVRRLWRHHLQAFLLFCSIITSLATRKDRRKRILLNTNGTFRPHGLPQQKVFAEEAREGEASCLCLIKPFCCLSAMRVIVNTCMEWGTLCSFALLTSNLCPLCSSRSIAMKSVCDVWSAPRKISTSSTRKTSRERLSWIFLLPAISFRSFYCCCPWWYWKDQYFVDKKNIMWATFSSISASFNFFPFILLLLPLVMLLRYWIKMYSREFWSEFFFCDCFHQRQFFNGSLFVIRQQAAVERQFMSHTVEFR